MTDRGDAIKREILDVLEWDQEAGKLQPATSLRTILVRPDVLEIMAMAHDQEESAQKGEPSPWAPWLVREHIEQNGQGAHDEWVSERVTAMRCALQAVGLA